MIEKVLHGTTLRNNSVPNRRIADKREIANVVCFLASGKADPMNGNIIVCDGGHTLLR